MSRAQAWASSSVRSGRMASSLIESDSEGVAPAPRGLMVSFERSAATALGGGHGRSEHGGAFLDERPDAFAGIGRLPARGLALDLGLDALGETALASGAQRALR